MSKDNPSITFLLTSIGEPSLTDTIRSLYGQFDWESEDVIKVYFDCVDPEKIKQFDSEKHLYNDRKPGSLQFLNLKKNLGFWGHGIRNKFQSKCTTDYIHHGDSDDHYVEGVVPDIKQDLRDNFGKLLIYKFVSWDRARLPKRPVIEGGQVGTACGLIPNRPEIFGEWGLFYGGDAQFYLQMQDKIGIENIVFKNLVIYACRP